MSKKKALQLIRRAIDKRSTSLNLTRLGLTALPPEIGQLTQLTELAVSHNQLTALPPEIGQLSQLTELNVWINRLTSLPPEIGQLRQLTMLDVWGNRLTSLPPEIFLLTQLRRLDVSRNRLTALPAEIGRLTRLTRLDLAKNELTLLPPELGQLAQLTDLDVSDNPLTSPPPSIVDQGTEAILAYLRDLGVSEQPNWRSKMLVVGEAAVGKTSLLKVLHGGDIDPKEKQTHGILIGDLSLSHPTEDGVDMALACWDFGGQEIYRATHQFFLSEESLFLLVWRPRRGDVESRIVHWLTSIDTRAPGSPILVVANQFEGDSPADLDFDQLRQDFPAIAGFYQVNAAAKTGIADLTEAIRDTAQALPMMGQAWPATWHSAATEIRQQKKQTLSATAFRKLLESLGLEQEDSRKAFGRSLHLLGDILHFQGDAELEDQVFLKPKWVSDLIVRAIESEQVVARDGVLTREHSKTLWADVDEQIRDQFTRLMERFDLSYRTPDRREISLVVDAIPKSRPADYDTAFREVAARAGSRTIRLTYAFPSLPAGVPTWFIARAHKFTTHTHWRTGAVFADDPDHSHMALVTASEAERQVAFEVCGPQPAYFLGVLKRQFEDTLSRYPGLEPKITIPCPGHNGAACDHAFDFRLLQKRLERDKPRYLMECTVAAANDEIEDPEIDIRQVLYGLHPATIDQVAKDLQAMRQDTASGQAEIMVALKSLSQQVTHSHLIQ